jgi:hypothetical protein
VRNLVSDIKRGTLNDGVRGLSVEEDTWAEERLSDGRLKKTA